MKSDVCFDFVFEKTATIVDHGVICFWVHRKSGVRGIFGLALQKIEWKPIVVSGFDRSWACVEIGM